MFSPSFFWYLEGSVSRHLFYYHFPSKQALSAMGISHNPAKKLAWFLSNQFQISLLRKITCRLHPIFPVHYLQRLQLLQLEMHLIVIIILCSLLLLDMNLPAIWHKYKGKRESHLGQVLPVLIKTPKVLFQS